MLFVSAHGSHHSRHLRLASRQDFFCHHQTRLRFSASASSSKAQHAKGYHALRLQPDLPSLQTKR